MNRSFKKTVSAIVAFILSASCFANMAFAESKMQITDVSVDNGKISAITIDGLAEGVTGKGIVAVYTSTGALKDVAFTANNVTDASNELTKKVAYSEKDGDTYKVFVWEVDKDGKIVPKPLAESFKSPVATTDPTETTTPTGTPAATETTKPTGTPAATETTKPTGTPAATETTKPTGTPAATETATPTGTPAVTETATPTGTPAVTETTKPTDTPVETATPTAIPTAIPAVKSAVTVGTVAEAEGTVAVTGADDLTAVAEGTELTIAATAKTGYAVDKITVTDADGAEVNVTNNKFKMPAKAVTVTVTFKVELLCKVDATYVNFFDETTSSTSYEGETPLAGYIKVSEGKLMSNGSTYMENNIVTIVSVDASEYENIKTAKLSFDALTQGGNNTQMRWGVLENYVDIASEDVTVTAANINELGGVATFKNTEGLGWTTKGAVTPYTVDVSDIVTASKGGKVTFFLSTTTGRATEISNLKVVVETGIPVNYKVGEQVYTDVYAKTGDEVLVAPTAEELTAGGIVLENAYISGWTIEGDDSGKLYTAEEINALAKAVTEEMTFVAKVVNTYKVTFAAEEGVTLAEDAVTEVTLDENAAVTFPTATANEGYNVVWYAKGTDADTKVEDTTKVTATAAVDYVAKAEVKKHSVTLDQNIGDLADVVIADVAYTDTVDAIVAKAEGLQTSTVVDGTTYTFMGWATTADATEVIANSTVIKDVETLYAVWSAKTVYTVTYYKADGTTPETTENVVEEGKAKLEATTAAPDETKYFIGWALTADATEAIEELTVTASVPLYPVFKDKAVVTVDYSAYGSFEEESEEVPETDAPETSAPETGDPVSLSDAEDPEATEAPAEATEAPAEATEAPTPAEPRKVVLYVVPGETVSQEAIDTALEGIVPTDAEKEITGWVVADDDEDAANDVAFVLGESKVEASMTIKPVLVTKTYDITVAETENGTVAVADELTKAAKGATITFTATANENHMAMPKVTYLDGETPVEVTVTPGENGEYSFTMPNKAVTITVTFLSMTFLEENFDSYEAGRIIASAGNDVETAPDPVTKGSIVYSAGRRGNGSLNCYAEFKTDNESQVLFVNSDGYADNGRGVVFTFAEDVIIPAVSELPAGKMLEMKFDTKSTQKITVSGFGDITTADLVKTDAYVNVRVILDKDANKQYLIVSDAEGNVLSTRTADLTATGFTGMSFRNNNGTFYIDNLSIKAIDKNIGTLNATVVDGDSAALEDVTVVIDGMTYKTDSEGKITALTLPNGEYSVVASKDGYEYTEGQADAQTLTATINSDTQSLNFTLKKQSYTAIPTTVTLAGGQGTIIAPADETPATSTAFTVASVIDQMNAEIDSGDYTVEWAIYPTGTTTPNENVTISDGVVSVAQAYTSENSVEVYDVVATVTANEQSATATVTTNIATNNVYYYEDFEDGTTTFTSNNTLTVGADTASKNAKTGNILYGGEASGDCSFKEAELPCSSISTGSVRISMDFRMDACQQDKSSNVALLGGANSANWLSSDKQILTISASASGNAYWGTITINGVDIKEAALVSGERGSTKLQDRDSTGWLNLDAVLDLDNKTVDVKLTRISDGSTVYEATDIAFLNADNVTSFSHIFGAAGKTYGGISFDNILVEKYVEAVAE